MKKALLFVFLFLLLVLGLEAYKHQMGTYTSYYSLSEVSPSEIANITLNNLLRTNHFAKCSFHVDVGSAGNGYYVYFIIINGSFKINVTLEGVAGEYKCVPEGVILYSYYLSDYWGKTHVFYYSYRKTWNLTFPSITKPIYYLNGSIIFLKQGNEELNVKPCLYWVDLKTGALSRKICLQEKHGATVGAVKFLGGKIYLATSTGHVYLVEGSEGRRAYFDSIWGITVGARLKLDVSEKYVAVAYSFANVEGKEKNGLCVLTTSLKKIACKSLKEEPQAVRIYGNTVYLQVGGKVKAYRILGL